MTLQSSLSHSFVIFADGACSGNPGPGGWGAIVTAPLGGEGVSSSRVKEMGGSEPLTTNNRMELTAVIRAIQEIGQSGSRIDVYTDSTYVIRGITQWIWGWRKRGWITAEGNEVANAELWKLLSEVTRDKKIQWKYVRGHQGIPGNERADQIAVAFSKGNGLRLYNGSLSQYPVDLTQIPESGELPEMKPKGSSPKKPYSYLSVVGNIPMRHTTWSQCESRVKGVPGARFKKAMDEEDEKAILNSWGFRIGEVK